MVCIHVLGCRQIAYRVINKTNKFEEREREMFYLTTHSTHFTILIVKRKEGNVLFNDALNTFYLRLYGVRHMVKDHSDSEKGKLLPPHRLLLSINRQDNTYHGLCYTSEE